MLLKLHPNIILSKSKLRAEIKQDRYTSIVS